MEWYNEPAAWDEEDGRLSVDVAGETDFWRVTRHDFVQDDGHFRYREVEGDFTATVEVAGEYATQYDQAGLMVREDESVWLKCGVEYVDGLQHASAVVTRDVSDWSVVPLEDDPDSLWLRVERTGTAVEVFYGRDGDSATMIRQAYLTDADRLQVGPTAAAPEGEGFRCHFENFEVQER